MLSIPLAEECREEEFRAAARHCLARGLAPDQVVFGGDGTLHLFAEETPAGAPAGGITVPRGYADLVPKIVCHSERTGLRCSIGFCGASITASASCSRTRSIPM